MKLKQLFTDDDSAVSPVIGVILMVAITVILAAVIATFVLGLGEQVSDTTPNANFNAENSGNLSASNAGELNGTEVVTFTHTNGPEIDAEALSLNYPGYDGDGSVGLNVTKASESISAGDSIAVQINGHDDPTSSSDSPFGPIFSEGDEISLTWSSDGNSATLNNYEVDQDIYIEADS